MNSYGRVIACHTQNPLIYTQLNTMIHTPLPLQTINYECVNSLLKSLVIQTSSTLKPFDTSGKIIRSITIIVKGSSKIWGEKMTLAYYNNNLEAYHPYSQLTAELGRMQGCKGAFGSQPHQPVMTTKNSQTSKVFDFFPEGRKPDGLDNPRGTSENEGTTQPTYGPGRVSNQGHLGERRALYAQANHAPRSIDAYRGMTSFFLGSKHRGKK